MSSFCTFFSKKFQHICISIDLNFNESLTNKVVSFEQLGPGLLEFVCVEVLRPSQPSGVMLSVVSLPNHIFA